MGQARKDTRTPAERARDTAGIVGSLKQEGYITTPEAEAVHQRVARGEITSEEAIRIFRDRAAITLAGGEGGREVMEDSQSGIEYGGK
jgi:Antitoxin VbhA